jgi:molybdenum cofactor cytidylyltransferase
MICAIVLAAGQSRRMGTQKLLLPLGDRPVIVHVVDALHCSPIDQTLVVLAPDALELRQTLAPMPVRLIVNPTVEGDMLSSVRSGLRALPPDCAAVLVALGDQPGLAPSLVTRMIHEFGLHPRRIVVPTHAARRGHPILFSVSYREEILTQFDDRGLRGLLDTHPGDVLEIEAPDATILEDLDRPEDYARMVSRKADASSVSRQTPSR